MHARLQKFLPLVLLALAMQVLAPIAACLAAGQAADPIQTALICHSAGVSGSDVDGETGVPSAHAGTCALCCLAQANASLDSPPASFSTPVRIAAAVVWHEADAAILAARADSNARARAPPKLS